jgi:hypothetical protein
MAPELLTVGPSALSTHATCDVTRTGSFSSLQKSSTLNSDLYSFAVTLWEIWSQCSTLPYSLLTNEELYQCLILRQSSYQNDDERQVLCNLSQPHNCPKEIYDLLCECWHNDSLKRPNIGDITNYFKRQLQLA